MDPWPWLHAGIDALTLLLAIRLTVLIQSHQQVSVHVSQRFAPQFVVVGEDK